MKQIFIDVREPVEFDLDHVDGAINLPLSTFLDETNKLQDLPKESEIVLYCNSGSRSGEALRELKQLGFTNLVNGVSKDQVVAKYNLN